jgi:hypothetical protein|tara:strand:+ start:2355 stop:3254 length:900 start_codon:yes stop_codon:yes gene_type:complete
MGNVRVSSITRTPVDQGGGVWGGLGAGTPPVGGTPQLSDSFESQDLSASLATQNSINFSWTESNRTGVVKQDGATAHRVWPTAYINSWTDGRDFTAKEGTYAMSIEYAAGIEMAEQRMAFDARSDLWLRYWLRVPENYYAADNGGDATSKFLAIWNTTYQAGVGGGATFWLSTFRSTGGSCNIAMTNMDGNTGTDLAYSQYVPFISVPSDRGRWMELVIHLKTETSAGASDGIIETWRRWDGDASFTALHSKTDAALYEVTGGWQAGYFMGWANDPYTADTWFLIDEVEIAATDIWGTT